MRKQIDERVSALVNVFSTKRASFESFRAAYEEFALHAVVENDFFDQWYEFLEKEKDKHVIESGWQKIYYNCYQRMSIIRRDDYSVDSIWAKMPQIIMNILNENMLLKTDKIEERCLIVAALIDYITAFAEGDDKVVYPAKVYKIISTLCKTGQLNSYYKEDAAKTVVNRTIRSVFDLQKYGGETHIIPGQMICEIMVKDEATADVADFCKAMLRTDDPKMAAVLNNSAAYTMEEILASKSVVQDFVDDVVGKKMDFKDTWTMLFGVLVVCICVVAFSIGRISGNTGKDQIATLESQVAVYQSAAESYSSEKEALESENKAALAELEKYKNAEKADEMKESKTETQQETKDAEKEAMTADAAADTYWTIPETVNLRETPALEDGNVLDVLYEGEEVYIVNEKDSDGWIEVYYDGYTGYINFEN